MYKTTVLAKCLHVIGDVYDCERKRRAKDEAQGEEESENAAGKLSVVVRDERRSRGHGKGGVEAGGEAEGEHEDERRRGAPEDGGSVDTISV